MLQPAGNSLNTDLARERETWELGLSHTSPAVVSAAV